MCPACMASAALMAGGVITTGGLTALVGRYFTQKRVRRRTVWTIQRKGEMAMTTATSKTELSKVVPQAEWLAARKEFLKKEKEFTRLRDELSRQRRALPREKVEKKYVFDGPRGKETLADLFGTRSQLIVYHFMLGPGGKEGCPSCSFLADTFDGAAVHRSEE